MCSSVEVILNKGFCSILCHVIICVFSVDLIFQFSISGMTYNCQLSIKFQNQKNSFRTICIMNNEHLFSNHIIS